MSKASEYLTKHQFSGRAKGRVLGERKNRMIGTVTYYDGAEPGLMLFDKDLPASTAIEFARWILDTFEER